MDPPQIASKVLEVPSKVLAREKYTQPAPAFYTVRPTQDSYGRALVRSHSYVKLAGNAAEGGELRRAALKIRSSDAVTAFICRLLPAYFIDGSPAGRCKGLAADLGLQFRGCVEFLY